MTELTDVLKREHKAREKCHLCFKENRKVRDHSHYTGLYRLTAHNNCNLKYWIPDHILILFHSLSGYDAHLFIKQLGKKNRDDTEVITENKEKYGNFNVKVNVKRGNLGELTNKDGK